MKISGSEKSAAARPGAFLDVSERALLALQGRDAQDLLQRLSTNDLSPLTISGAVQTVLTNEKGRMIDVVSVLKLDETRLLLAGQSSRTDDLVRWLDKFIIMEDAVIEPVTSAYTHFAAFNVYPRAEVWEERADSESSRTYVEEWGGVKLLHFLVDVSRKEEIANLFSGIGLRPVERAEFEEFRVKNGIPCSPNELSDGYNPLEANLDHLISWTKGCYIGQEVIARLDTYRKVQRRLVKLTLTDMPEALPATLFSERDEAGTITSAVRLPDDSSFLGLGYVRTHSLETGGNLVFRKNGNEVRAILIKG